MFLINCDNIIVIDIDDDRCNKLVIDDEDEDEIGDDLLYLIMVPPTF